MNKLSKPIVFIVITLLSLLYSLNVFAYSNNDTLAWVSGTSSYSVNLGYQPSPITVTRAISYSATSNTFNGYQVNLIDIQSGMTGVGNGTSVNISVSLYDKMGQLVQSQPASFSHSSDVFGSNPSKIHTFNFSLYDKTKYDLSECYFVCTGSGTWKFTGGGTPNISVYTLSPIMKSVVQSPIISTNLAK